jgi:GntR family transcriptional regulator
MNQPALNLRPNTRPLYIQAVDALYELLESGAYAPGEMLPTEAELGARLGVSRSTIREALSHLEKDALIIRRQGVGTFRAPLSPVISGGLERLSSFRSVAEASGVTVQTLSHSVVIEPAALDIAHALDIPLASAVAVVRTVEAVDGCQMAYLAGYIVAGAVELDRLVAHDGSLLEFLVSEPGQYAVSYSRSAISAVTSDATIADALGVAAGTAILHLAETVFTEADAPVAYFKNFFITECYNLKIVRRIARSAGRVGRAIQGRTEHGTV